MTIAGAVPRVISRAVSRAVSASLFGAVPRGTGADALLYGEDDGLAFDFTNQSARIKDTTTLANNYKSTGIVAGGALVGPSGKLTYTSPSNKLTLQSDGYYKYQAHNLCLQSEDFTTTWGDSSGGVTIVANAAVAPDGSTTADSLQNNVTTPGTIVSQNNITTIAGGTYAFNLRVKASVDGFIRYQIVDNASQLNGAQGWLNTSTGSWGTIASKGSGTLIDYSAEAIGDGWYLLSMVSTVTTTNTIVIVQLVGSNASTTPSTTPVVYVWGAHVYRYPANTDYIKTTTAAKYALPLEYDTSGNCLGLLVEDARTNLVTYSTQFDNAAWTKVSSTISANAAVAPNGLSHADKLVEDNSLATSHYTQQAVTVSGTTTYTASVYAKAGEKSWIRMTSSGAGGGNSHFDLANGIVGTVTTTSASIEDVGNGWYRCSHTWTTGAITSSTFQIYIAEADNDITFDGDSSSGVYLWNAQIEAVSFPTSPIITYGATATRAADNISIATSAFPWTYLQGSFGAQLNSADSANATYVFDTDSSRVYHYQAANPVSGCGAGGVEVFTGTTISNGETYNVELSYDSAGLSHSINGVATETDAALTLVSGATSLYVGQRFSAAQRLNGILSYIRYVPRKKSAAELESDSA